ncbi:MAG TPA: hypothetical protein VGD10_11000 [Allosphingosinicella sp.]|uniref:hypothetical protein n=1 Tax=Allosphingosinicella sp. TaxID=2823234 RepID=UPI002EDB2CD8
MGMLKFLLVGSLFAGTTPATAQSPSPTDTPQQIRRMIACRDLTAAADRLACYDRETASVAEAIARRDLVAVDREQVRSTKRSLFGLSLPNLKIFGGDEEDEVKQVEGSIASVAWNRNDGYTFVLQDGARWRQTDDKPFALEPRRGDKVLVKRGALGSYMLSVAGQPSVKVQRVN